MMFFLIGCMIKDIKKDYQFYKENDGKRSFIGFVFKEKHPNFFYNYF